MNYHVIANFGNESIALIQWLYDNHIENITVLSVETSFGATSWLGRVKKARAWVTSLGFKEVRLESKPSMTDCITDRKGFPSKKFSWCAGFVKGLAFEGYLDEVDSGCEETIIFSKRHEASRVNLTLDEFGTSEHFNGRQSWHPILNMADDARNDLIKKAGFDVLPYTSRECMPCIHSREADITQLTHEEINRVAALETKLNQTMFDKPIQTFFDNAQNTLQSSHATLEDYDKGCGSAFGCGE
jgi:hypothetical protein